MGPKGPRRTKMCAKRKRFYIEIFIMIVVTLLIMVCFLIFVLLTNGIPQSNNFDKPPCGPEWPMFSVNISEAAEDQHGNFKTKDGLLYTSGQFWKSNSSIFGCPCLLKPCVRKCCPLNHEYGVSTDSLTYSCVPSSTNFFTSIKDEVFTKVQVRGLTDNFHQKSIDEDHFFTLFRECDSSITLVSLINLLMLVQVPFLMEDGRVLGYGASQYIYDQSEYCLETVNGSDKIQVYLCEYLDSKMQFDLNYEVISWCIYILFYGKRLSVTLILLSLMVYVVLPKLRNLQGKCLMCYMITLLFGYILNFKFEFIGTYEGCLAYKLLNRFCTLSTFFWINAMCFDIWLTFNRLNLTSVFNDEADSKTILFYTLYSWGCPFILCVIFFIAKTRFNPSPYFDGSNFVQQDCWRTMYDLSNLSTILFFMPMVILECLSLLMFVATLVHLINHNKEANLLHVESENSKKHRKNMWERFYMYLKLTFIMGVLWIGEVIAIVSRAYELWTLKFIFDVTNVNQGILIFLIFVCKIRTFRLLKERLYLCLKVRDNKFTLSGRPTNSSTNEFSQLNSFELTTSLKSKARQGNQKSEPLIF